MYLKTKKNGGALILEVMENSQADKVDLKSGDVIVELDGDPVESPEDVTDILSDFEVGDKIDLVVLSTTNIWTALQALRLDEDADGSRLYRFFILKHLFQCFSLSN